MSFRFRKRPCLGGRRQRALEVDTSADATRLGRRVVTVVLGNIASVRPTWAM